MSTSQPTKRRRTNDREISLDNSDSRPMKPVRSPSRPTTSIPSRAKTTSNTPINPQAEEDWTSSSGSDSDSDSDSSARIINAPPTISGPLPPIDPTIHTRLTSFFSSLAEQRANPDAASKPEKIEIESDSDSGFEDEDRNAEGQGRRGQYIELDLALGVLSEKGSDDEDGEVRVPGVGGDSGENSESEGGDGESEGDSGKGRLEGLTNVAEKSSGLSQAQRRKARREEQKRKIEEVG